MKLTLHFIINLAYWFSTRVLVGSGGQGEDVGLPMQWSIGSNGSPGDPGRGYLGGPGRPGLRGGSLLWRMRERDS